MKQFVGLVVAILFLLFALIGCGGSLFAPSPEQYAAATATLMRAQSIAMADRASNDAHTTEVLGEARATATVAAAAAQATVVAFAQSAQATQTVAPIVAGRLENQARADNAGDWVRLGLFATIGIALSALLFAFVAFVRTRAQQLPRSRDGQMQPVLIGNTVIDPSRMIGAAVTAPRSPGWLEQLARVLEWRKTGHLPARPEPRVLLTDGGADANHYLAAAESANQATAVAALMRPDQSDAARKDRIEMTRKVGGPGLLGGGSSVTRIVGYGDDAVKEFARALARDMGDHLQDPPEPTISISAPPALTPPASAEQPPVLSDDDGTTLTRRTAGAPQDDVPSWAKANPQEAE